MPETAARTQHETVGAIYRMATLGNHPDLFPDSDYVEKRQNGYTGYDIPPEALADGAFAAVTMEAEKFLGYPHAWGESSSSTSFDCSGFVCRVINHSGWSVGRTSTQGFITSAPQSPAAMHNPVIWFSSKEPMIHRAFPM